MTFYHQRRGKPDGSRFAIPYLDGVFSAGFGFIYTKKRRKEWLGNGRNWRLIVSKRRRHMKEIEGGGSNCMSLGEGDGDRRLPWLTK